jgi:hypothetical protein
MTTDAPPPLGRRGAHVAVAMNVAVGSVPSESRQSLKRVKVQRCAKACGWAVWAVVVVPGCWVLVERCWGVCCVLCGWV